MKAFRTLFLIGMAIFALFLMVGIVPTTSASVTADAPQAKDAADDAASAAARLERDSGGTAQVSINQATDVASFIRVAPGSLDFNVAASADEAAAVSQANGFLDAYGALFGITDAQAQLELAETRAYGMGNTYVSYHQIERGVPVYAAILKVHFDAKGQLYAANGVFVPNIKAGTTPKLSADAAADIAVAEVASQQGAGLVASYAATQLEAKGSILEFFRTGLVEGKNGATVLVYEVEVIDGANIREFVFVNALNGEVVEQFTGVYGNTPPTQNVYDGGYGPSFLVWTDPPGTPLPTGDAEYDNVIYGASETYNLFASAFSFDSYDNAGATMESVAYRPDSCPNASWNGTFVSYCQGVSGDDTVAHEWGHAYTQYTSNLVYAWQPGALNESYSDIWGDTVDLLNGRGIDTPDVVRASNTCSSNVAGANFPGNPTVDTVRWLSGEDDPAFNGIPGGSGNAIRDMWDPTCFGDPGKVSDDEYWCSSGDVGGVHTNSGVPNHAYALLVDGGTYNGQTVAAIGLTKAAHIHWGAQNMLTITSNFVAHADALEASCTALIGQPLNGLDTDSSTGTPSGEVITADDCAAVSAAVSAVELRVEPTQCGFEPAWTDAPALCEGQGNGTVSSIATQDWESGIGDWTFGTHNIANPDSFDNPDWTIRGDLPDLRSGSAMYVEDSITRGACTPDDTVAGALNLDSPLIVLPATAEVPRVAVNHFVATELGWDGGNLKISVNGSDWTVVPDSAFEVNGYFPPGAINGGGNDNPLAGEEGWTGGGEGEVATGWGQSQVNLLGLASPGDTIQLRFDMGLDGCFGVDGWYVDEVEVYSCEDEMAGGFCGNGLLDPGETCDDGNTANGDGCSDICQVENGWTCTDPTPGDPNGSNAVGDWSFEAGAPGNPYWTEFSTFTGISGFPFCGADNGCPAAGVTTTGNWAIWIGGLAAGVTSTVDQSIIIPTTATELTAQALRGVCDDPSDVLHFSLDGTDIGTLACDTVDGDFVQQTFSVAGYNDGGSHDLTIGGTVGGTNGTHSNFFVDDVTVYDNVATDPTPSECTPIPAGDWVCNGTPEAFEIGIPSSWTLVDNSSPANPWVTTANTGACSIFSTPIGNSTPGSGEAACISSDIAGSGSLTDSYLCSPPIDLSTAAAASFDFDFFFDSRQFDGVNDVEIVASTTGPNGPYDVLHTFSQDGSGSDISSAESVDLSAYAGQSDVTVCARYHSGWNYATQMDNAVVSCEVPVTLYCEGPVVGFEDGAIPSDWYIESAALPGGEWLVSTNNSSDFFTIPPAPEGSYYASANDDFAGSGSDGSMDYLYTNVFNLSDVGVAALNFQYFFTGEYGQAAGGVQVSSDGGATWDSEVIVPTGDAWSPYMLDLSAYAGNANVQVRFHSDDGGAWATGFGVDAVSLGCGAAVPPEIDVDPTALHQAQTVDQSFDQSFTISNSGEGDLNWNISEANGANGRSAGLLTEGFDDITNLPGWATDNNPDVVGTTEWFQGNDAVFAAHEGAPTAYIGANFNNTGGSQISNWLMMPEMSFEDGQTMSFWTRTGAGSTFPDRLQVRVSTSGASTDVGAAPDSVGDFTNLELDINETLSIGGYPEDWTQFTVDLSAYAGNAGWVAFRYYVPVSAGPVGDNSNFIGIDTVEVQGGGGPGPSSCENPADIPWATLSATNGTTAPSGSDSVVVTFDSTGMEYGTYNGTLCVESNDEDEPLVEVDLTLSVTGDADYSDGAASYGMAWHSDPRPFYPRSLWLGAGVTNDPTNIDGQDATSNDGVTRIGQWVSGGTAELEVQVSGVSNDGWFAGWVDWNNNGVFDSPEERVVDEAVVNGTNTVYFDIPSSYTTGDPIVARFRIYYGAPLVARPSLAEPTGGEIDGEVEDYTWEFTATAVDLNGIGGQSAATSPGLIVIALLGVTIAAFGLFVRRRTE